MDNLTHTLFGATLARTPIGRAGRGATLTLILASNAPDIDFIAVAGGGLGYLQWHRGPTHGPLGIVGLGLTTAGLVWAGQRAFGTPRDGDRPSFGALAGLSILGVFLHVLMDLPTSYGTRLLSPFAWHWYAKDWMPIVDINLLAILSAGLAFGRRPPRAGPGGGDAPPAGGWDPAWTAAGRNATIALMLMAAHYGLRATAHHRAIGEAPGLFGPLLPPPCEGAVPAGALPDRWPPRTSLPARDQGATRCLREIAAIPSLLSPFQWRLIAQLSNAYQISDLDLFDRSLRTPPADADAPWRRARRVPNQWTPAVVKASETRVGQVFLGFARFPAARSVIERDGTVVVRWNDVRFFDRPVANDGPAARGNLFAATVRVGSDGQILQQRLGR